MVCILMIGCMGDGNVGFVMGDCFDGVVDLLDVGYGVDLKCLKVIVMW